jgi:nucleoside-diphosphate-sugar epimerase
VPRQKTSIQNLSELETALSEPTEATIRTLAALGGDLLILGVGGKMGPTLARMAKRATDAAGTKRRIIGVSRFSADAELCPLERQLQSSGIETIRCDLLNRQSLQKLPDASLIVYMAGMKFGSTGQESLTWAMNSYLPGLVCERYPASRIAAFSTGNIYGLTPVTGSGSKESDLPNPVGEYATSCLGRERIFEHFSRANRTPVSIIRLNYSTELRYGVLVDIATRVHTGQPVSLSMGYLNAIWQRDANAMSLETLAHASHPPFVINIAGPELLSVRKIAEQFSERFGKPVRFSGSEAEDALLSDSAKSRSLFGEPTVSVDQMLDWIADWVARGGESLSKPTHFEERSGRF